jgi:hypothetical protein
MVLDPDRDGVRTAQAFLGADAAAQAGRYFYSTLAGDIPAASGARVPVPRKLVTDSLEFYGSVKDALAELGIEVLYAENVPPLDQLRQSLLDHMSRESPR